ncbi:DUF1572 family protein [Aureisphaera galaxeae]|uniref:DUF1572 family protein n=1 Tax=Aureisphaera galaxeae TaxID=1538023 RepID=UPI0023500148|nr:DUF1572 family protein [Aureisphaera galaxeae]MDC8005659.1 DUF1572 family protein [Aureisphaera galaxeae]
MNQSYLHSAKKQFQYYKVLGEKTFQQLSDEELLWQYNPESNSIAITVNHLWGNMLSRWTDFLISDGEKEWRNRDLEFESVIQSREELKQKWNEGWKCLFEALESITPEYYDAKVYIRNQEHSIEEALNRQMMHYAYHVGQIVYVGRMLKGSAWKSLSIPKGESKTFNREKFSKGKHGGHFTDDIK